MKMQSRSYGSVSISEVDGALASSTTKSSWLFRLLKGITGGLVAPPRRRFDKRSASGLGGALTYPLIMMTVGTGVIVFLVAYVVPQVATIFVQQHAALPLETKLLIRFSAFITGHWLAVTIPSLLLVVGSAGALLTPRGRSLYHHYDHQLAQSPQITEWLEVVMTLAMAAVIVFMMLAVLMPIFQLNQLMQ
jgi:type II secretory pathway component PulF